jgi:hypothetical protein
LRNARTAARGAISAISVSSMNDWDCGGFDPFDNDTTKLTLAYGECFLTAACGEVGERVRSAMKRHSPVPSLGHSDVGSALLNGH